MLIARLIPPSLALLLALPSSVSALSQSPEFFSSRTQVAIRQPAGQGADGRATVRTLIEGAKRAAEEIAAAPHHQPTAGTSALVTQPAKSSRGWFSRHPVWTGAIIGTAAGTAIAAIRSGSEGTPVGFWGGAALGAGVGWIVSAAK